MKKKMIHGLTLFFFCSIGLVSAAVSNNNNNDSGSSSLGGWGWPFNGQDEAEATLPFDQQQLLMSGQDSNGIFMPFPQGVAPNGTRYKTDYRCEGEDMVLSCHEDVEATIEVVRGNFGRFSIAICNRHGKTDWSVNCHAPETTNILKKRCDGLKRCVIPVQSSHFPDACPNTLKYLEVHYACKGGKAATQGQRIPPWIIRHDDQNHRGSSSVKDGENRSNSQDDSDSVVAGTANPRKPILVTEKIRVPITTPRPETSSTGASLSVNQDVTDFKEQNQHFLTEDDIKEIDLTPSSKSELTIKPSTPSSTTRRNEASPNHGQYDSETWCPATTSRQLQWDWTPVGKKIVQPCPIGAIGHARWSCGKTNSGAVWGPSDRPDMSNCKSIAMTNLEGQVRKDDPENVIVSALSYVTRTKSLFGGDLEIVIATMRTIASRMEFRLQQANGAFHNKESHIRQILQNIIQSASNLLEPLNRQAWLDLSLRQRMKMMTQLMIAIEESSFVLAGVMNSNNAVLESSEIMTVFISVIDATGVQSLVFPSAQDKLLYVDDSIRVSGTDLRNNAHNDLVSRTVFLSFTNLHEIIQHAPRRIRQHDLSPNHVLNSRIISAALSKPEQHIKLSQPVTVNLHHLQSTNMTDPICVFWDYDAHGWSDIGCEVIQTNDTNTVCQCNHLTHFAVLMRHKTRSGFQMFLTKLGERIDVILSVMAAILVFVGAITAFKCRRRLESLCSRCSCGCCIKTHEVMHKSQSFYTGLTQSNVLSSGSSSAGSSSGSGSRSTGFNSVKKNSFPSNTLSANRLHSQYVLNTHHSLRPGHFQQTPLSAVNRHHVTLNPYSSQLVENINLMMGRQRQQQHQQQQQQQQQEVVYRPVSPHGHVYWEIDPNLIGKGNMVMSEGSSSFSQQDPLLTSSSTEPNFQQDPMRSSTLDEINRYYQHDHHQQQHQQFPRQNSIHRLAQCPSEIHPLISSSASVNQDLSLRPSSSVDFRRSQSNNGFVRTGAGRFNRSHHGPHRTLDLASHGNSSSSNNNNNVPEQIQQQVQIKDIKPIHVSVKSSEYIEAKIRTLRNNNRNKEEKR